MRGVLVFWGQNCKLLVVDSLLWTAIKYCVTNWRFKKKKIQRAAKTSLFLTTTMVNPKIPKNSNKNPTLSPGLQDSSQYVGESLDSLNPISRTSSRAGKQVYFRGRPQTRYIAKRSFRSVSASSASRNSFPEALSSFSSGKSEEESVSSDPKTHTALRVVTGKLSSKDCLL